MIPDPAPEERLRDVEDARREIEQHPGALPPDGELVWAHGSRRVAGGSVTADKLTREQVEAIRERELGGPFDITLFENVTIRALCDSWLAQDDALREAAAREAALVERFKVVLYIPPLSEAENYKAWVTTAEAIRRDGARFLAANVSDAARELAEKAALWDEHEAQRIAKRDDEGYCTTCGCPDAESGDRIHELEERIEKWEDYGKSHENCVPLDTYLAAEDKITEADARNARLRELGDAMAEGCDHDAEAQLPVAGCPGCAWRKETRE